VRVIAVANGKGGSGKTSTAVNLAAALAEAGERVLVVDLDPQGCSSSWLGAADPAAGGRMLEALEGKRDPTELVRGAGVDVIPSSPMLAGAERALTMRPGGELAVRRMLARLPADRWRWCLVDCEPSAGLLVVGALAAADAVLIPVEVSALALDGLDRILTLAEDVRANLNPGLGLVGVVPVRVEHRTRHTAEVLEELERRLPGKVLPAIPESVRMREAPSFSPITTHDPNGRAAGAFRELAQAFTKREGKP
jgi:chromosome partitioning protein